MWHELNETILALIDSFDVPAGSGLVITGVQIDFPLEVSSTIVRDGHLVFLATPPFTRFVSGVLPKVHASHLSFQLIDSAGIVVDRTHEEHNRG